MKATPEDPHAGQVVYHPKGWTEIQERNALIRKEYRQLLRAGTKKMAGMRVLARRFHLHFKTIQDVIYERVKK